MNAIVPSHRRWGNLESASDGLVMRPSHQADLGKTAQLQPIPRQGDRLVAGDRYRRDLPSKVRNGAAHESTSGPSFGGCTSFSPLEDVTPCQQDGDDCYDQHRERLPTDALKKAATFFISILH